MRVADKMNFDQVRSQISRNRTDMAGLQNQAALQKRVTKPSDDPMAAARVMAASTEIQGTEQFLKNMNFAKSFLENTDQTLGELTEVMIRAKELAINQANDASANSASRKMAAIEVKQIYDHVLNISNRKVGDRFLFAGYRTTLMPFTENGHYRGDNGEMLIQVNKDDFVAMNLPGTKIFYGKDYPNFEATANGNLPKNKIIPEDEIIDPAEPTQEAASVPVRGPASVFDVDEQIDGSDTGLVPVSEGVNVFKVLKDLEIGLATNDKATIQEDLEVLDQAISQVIHFRSTLGARVMTLNSAMETLQKSKVESHILKSTLEDADTFALVSDINKTETGLQATLASSGKLIQPSLLDFLR